MRGLGDFLKDNLPWLAAGFLLTLTSSFGQTFFISVFAGEIRAEFGLSHGQWGTLYMAATMTSALAMLFAGELTDRFRVRHLGVAVLTGLAVAALSMSQSGSVWALGLTVFLLRFFGQGLMSHTAYVAMARWFVVQRGRAVAVAGLGVSMGEALLPLTAVALMGIASWRGLWIGVACLLLAVAPFLWRLLRNERTPQSFAASDTSVGMDGRSWTRPEMLRHWLFWLMLPAILGPPAWTTALFFHQVHVAEVKGWAHAELVALFPLYTLSSVGFMMLTGWATDRFGSGRLAGIYLLPAACGYALMAASTGVPPGGLALVLIGVSVGMHATMGATFWAEHYGTRNIGSIRAATAAAMVLASALGPGLTGTLIDLGLPFPLQCYGIAAYYVAASALAALGALRAAPALRRTTSATHPDTPRDSASS